MDSSTEAHVDQEKPIEYLTEPTDSIEHLFCMAQALGIRAYHSGGTELHTNAPMPKLFGFYGASLIVQPKEMILHWEYSTERGGIGTHESDEVIVAAGFQSVIYNGNLAIEAWTPPIPDKENLSNRIYEKCFVRLGGADFRLARTDADRIEEARMSIPVLPPRRRGYN